jgi:hypothetical protein
MFITWEIFGLCVASFAYGVGSAFLGILIWKLGEKNGKKGKR